ncbi:hypothetical protein F6J84_11340 [Microbacterium caowuchunii]|uniref:hypothetical protein n=1 Tax=Microbacterium caowuchunii TaxID=2614638 RepID=UPI0012457C2F|nr:hypothetical protein [Microbacterium caowuchunii]QEW00631.1 hypothetical protein F6J84_11340 [Microbacterium caowuchunii]
MSPRSAPVSRSLRLLAVFAALSMTMGFLSWVAASPAAATSTSSSATTVTADTTTASVRPSADLSLFRPGNIIADQPFFDSASMTEAQIDSFLRQKVARCQSGYVCLKDFRQATTTRPADAYCSGYSGEGSESAARIVYKVARACGINPQVLLVMLEKEQGLITHTWPSDWRYTIAMGQGCPDTAACDTRYYGFFNQVYGAARQLQIYIEGRYFTYYAPGRTWNIRYHPNASCGTSPVYVENKATSALYYYTPYQPNAAALRAGYGEGDSCSSYGNRNFYQLFTDWFGSTQGKQSAVVQAAGRPEVYLISNGTKHHITSYDDLLVLQSRLGRISSVSTRYVDDLPTGKAAGRYVHDPRSGTLYLLEGDGTKHRFASVEQVALFGYPFESFVNLESRLIDAFSTGAEVGPFIRSGNAPEVFAIESGARRHIYDGSAWQWATRNTPGYVATMRTDAAQALPAGATLFAPNTLVRGASSGDVLLVTPTEPLIHIPSFELAAEFGATTYRVVPDEALARNTVAPSSLTLGVTCGSKRYLAVGGTLMPVGADTGGLASTALSDAQCAAWRTSASTMTAPLFVQPQGSGDVFTVEGGKLRHVRTYEQLMSLNGPRPLALIRWSRGTADFIGRGAPLLAEKSVVQFRGTPEVYQFSGGQLHHVQSYATLVSLGNGQVPRIETLDSAFLQSYPMGTPIG